MASTNAPAVAIGMQKSSDSNRRNQPSNPATSTRSHEDKTPCYDLDCGDCCAFNDIDCKDGCTDCSCDSCVSSCKGCLPTISVESEKHTRMLLLSGLCIQLLASLLYIIATSTPHWTIIDSSTVLARAGLWGGQYNGRRYIVSSDTACDLFIDGLGVEGGAAIIGLDPKDCESLNGQRATCLLGEWTRIFVYTRICELYVCMYVCMNVCLYVYISE